MPIIKKLFSALAVAILATVGAFVAATPAHAASGYVTCATSNVVGVWVDVDGGTDGWAYRSGSGNTNYYSYNTQGKRWRVNVGCGGTPRTGLSRLALTGAICRTGQLLRAPMRDTSGPVGSGSSREDLSQVYKLALFSCRDTMLLSCILQMVYVRGQLFFCFF